jgi:hypothetical protein
MRFAISRKIIVFGVIGALALVVGLTEFATGSDSPPRPAWVDANGRVDTSKMPARMPVLNSHGDVAGYINTSDLNASPQGPGKDRTSIPIFAAPTGSKRTGKDLVTGAPPEGGPPGPAPVAASH